jgi:signal transduction histidine kinase
VIVIRIWGSGRFWREVAYVLLGAIMRLPTFALALVAIAATALSVVIFGLAMLAGVLALARLTPRYFRWPTRRLLDRPAWPDPRPLAGRSRWQRLTALLGNAAAWRAVAYCFAGFPLIYAGAYAVAISFSTALAAVTYPLWYFLDANPFGLLDAHTWAQTWIEAGQGALVLLVLPWFVRLVVLADVRLARTLLQPSPADRRIAQLEAGRAALQADSAALLRRVERDLHDGTQARLVSLGVALSRIEHKTTEPAVRDLAADTRTMITDALSELRDIVRGLHPPALDDGLDVALSTLAGRSAVPAEVAVTLTGRPPDATASAIYFSVAELLTNVTRHASAGRARITLTDDADRLTLTVHDDGHGGAAAGRGTGLPGLARRAEALDGDLRITSPPGGPTVVTMTLPREY